MFVEGPPPAGEGEVESRILVVPSEVTNFAQSPLGTLSRDRPTEAIPEAPGVTRGTVA